MDALELSVLSLGRLGLLPWGCLQRLLPWLPAPHGPCPISICLPPSSPEAPFSRPLRSLYGQASLTQTYTQRHAHTDIRTHTHTHAHTDTHMHVRTCAHTKTHTYTDTLTYTGACAHAHTDICTYTYIHIQTCTHIDTHIHVCTHRYMHAQTHTSSSHPAPQPLCRSSDSSLCALG